MKNNIKSIVIPLVGTGLRGLPKEEVLKIILEVANDRDWCMNIVIVRFEK